MISKNVTIIGGGIAGISIARLLSKKGIKNIVLERGSQLCVGSTWHAAGLVTRFASSAKLKKIHVRSLEIMNEIHNTAEGGISLHTPGSIRIIEKNNRDRLLEAKQQLALAMLYDDPNYKTELITPAEIKSMHPYIDISNIEAGLFTPNDGDVDPTQLTNYLAKEAKINGTKIILNQEVLNIKKKKDKFIVKTNDNEYSSDIVINAAGLWSRKISKMIGLYQPSMVIEHQYVITEDVPITKSLPVIRDLKGSSYIRKEGRGFLIGPYEEDCQIKNWDDFSPPMNWADMDLFPDNVDRISDNILKAIDLIPEIGNVGIKTVINGPTIWTGDSLPRVGPTNIPGWYDFNSLTYGIAQSLGLSEYLSDIIIKGIQPFDAIDYFNPSRYDSWANDKYVKKKIIETYSHNNSITYPYENRSSANKYVDKYPLYNILKEDGAKFGQINGGVSTPFLFSNDQTIEVNDLKSIYKFPWNDTVLNEANKVLNNVGLSYSYFSKIKIMGKDSRKFLDKLCVSKLPKKEGNCKLAYFTNYNGKLVSEFTICCIDDYFYLVGNGAHSKYDFEWLKMHSFGDVEIENHTQNIEILHIAGPNSTKLLSSIDERISDLKFMKMKKIKNFGNSNINLNLFKVSFTGCLGYELHVDRNKSIDLYKFIKNNQNSLDMNLSMFGSMALNSLRIEKGFKTYVDLDYKHYLDANIDNFICKNKNENIDKKIYKETTDGKISSLFKIYTDKHWEWSVIGDSPIIDSQNNVIGYITSSARGAKSKDTIALGYIDKLFDSNNEDIYVNCYGNIWKIHTI